MCLTKYTFIIPVYNTKIELLNRCLSSIINQSGNYNNYEILIIDDGSTNEKTISFLNNIKNEKCKIFYNTNHGVSYSRNYGILKAKSNNLIFVDSDDFISSMFVDKLERINIDNYDLIYFKNYELINEKKIYKSKKFNFDVVWAKIFKKNIILKYNVFFKENLKFCEDTIFLYEYRSHIKQDYYVNSYEYTYVINNQSVGHNYNKNNYIYFNESINALKPFTTDSKINDVILSFFLDYVLPTSIFHKSSSLSNKEKKKDAIELMNNPKFNYNHILNFKLKKFNFFRKIQIILLKIHCFRLVLFINFVLKKIKYLVRRN